jgi:hypothetical protein
MATVDTLKAYETLTGADMPDRQARALITIVQELQETRLAEVASKGDIAALKEDIAAFKNDYRAFELSTKTEFALLRSEMKEMEARLEAKIDRVKLDLLKWFIPLILGQAAFIVTLLKLLK